jgi:flagellar protein FliO/FliZ
MTPSPDLTMAGIKMVLVLLLLLGVLLSALYAFRRLAGAGQASGRPIRVLASSYLGPRKVISMVEIPGKILVLGVTKNDIRVLDRIDDEGVLAGFRTSEGAAAPTAFSAHLKRLMARAGKRR